MGKGQCVHSVIVLILVSAFLPTLAVPEDSAGAEQAKLIRRLEKKARELESAVAKLVARCRRCGGGGRLLRRGQRVRCVDCKGTGRKVSKVFYVKIFWKMRSSCYRKTSGLGATVRAASLEAMQREAKPLRAGAFHSVESLDDTHAVSWHGSKANGFVYYRWILEDDHGWSMYSPKFDGSWPDSNIDLGYPEAKVSDKIHSVYDKFKDETRVMTSPIEVGSDLRFVASFSQHGMSATGRVGDLLIVFLSSSKGWRFLKRNQRQVNLLANGEALPELKLVHSGDVVSGGVKESLGASLPRADFARIVEAASIEGRLGLTARFSFTPLQRRILGELLRRFDLASR